MFRLQFDHFQVVSSSHDDTILIWDFLDTEKNPDVFVTNPMDVTSTTQEKDLSENSSKNSISKLTSDQLSSI